MHNEQFKLQEVEDQWVSLLKTLPQREAFVRVENRTQRIKTLRRLPNQAPYDQVKELITSYTKQLMTPLSVVKQEVDGILQPISETAVDRPQDGQKLLPAPSYLLEPVIKRQRTLPEF